MSEQPIRVLHILNGILGGAEVVAYNYYRQMDTTKIQFDFVIHEGTVSQVPDDVKSLGCKIYEIPPYSHPFKYIATIRKICKKGRYKIVHSHMNAMSVFPLYAAKKASVPVRIAHSHSTSGKGEYKKDLVKNILRPFSKLFPTHLFACSEHAGRWLFGNKTFDVGKVTIIRNAIDVEKFRFNPKTRAMVRKDLGLEDKFVIGHVGRFMTQKNHTFLLEIFAEILKIRKDSHLIMVGDGELKKESEEKVQKLGINKNVSFLGMRDDVSVLYTGMDTLVLPSLYEGLPLVGVEAQCAGLPCVFSEDITKETITCGSAETMPLEAGAEAWAKKIIEKAMFYDNSNEMEYCRRIEQSIFVTDLWNIRSEANKLQKLYQTAWSNPV